MTIDEINREIIKLEQLRDKKEKELLSNLKDYIGKYYKRDDFTIGQVYNAEVVLDVKELYFDDYSYQIYNDNDSCEPEEIEIISTSEFVKILNEWVSKILKKYDIQITE